MDIAGLSVGLSQVKLQQQAAISVTKMAMDTAQTKGDT
ncbi:YjfB family protein [Desulfosporosinus sp.]|nr:YjfB family protein [Desulfosporosinus sp.]MBC2723562.1 YjfB family protein [Desulfosporosinus sp.]MBC2726153.1 YjfB family protein [Desulfosporosinus sp.]